MSRLAEEVAVPRDDVAAAADVCDDGVPSECRLLGNLCNSNSHFPSRHYCRSSLKINGWFYEHGREKDSATPHANLPRIA